MAGVTRAGLAWIMDRRGQPVGQLQATLGCGQKHDAAIRGDAAALEGGCDLLAPNGWKRERQQRIVGYGGCSSRDAVEGLA